MVRNKVGSAGFYLDLAIADADNPGRYILGVECDGQSYASSRSATDRDRLRSQVLEMFGWRVYRVWSTDWYRNPERELKRLVAAIEQAKDATAAIDEEIAAYEEEQRLLDREEPQEVLVEQTPVYIQAVLPDAIARQEMHLHSFGHLAHWISEVVKVESPVHFDEVARRMADAAGVSKVGTRIKYTLTQACRHTELAGLIKIKGDFLWHPEMESPVVRNRSSQPASSRRLQNIAPEEIAEAIKQIVSQSIAITHEAAIPLVAKLFGFARVTEDMKQLLHEAITQAEAQDIIKLENGYFRLNN